MSKDKQCKDWCLLCLSIQYEFPHEDPCDLCHDCNPDLEAAEEATWD